ncbi:MAG: PD40 domain-containing protein [Phycisphaerales bacterium]|nr:PD40 domain-containing protein [Phycisphaerales bacterium]
MSRLSASIVGASVVSMSLLACASHKATSHASADADAPEPAPIDWRAEERGEFADYAQLTFPDKYLRAGEQYFSPDAKWIIFQATLRAEADPSDPQAVPYAMYVAKLKWDDQKIVGIEEPIRVSEPGSANTCGWFHPTEPWRILFGSTITPPTEDEHSGYQRARGSYKWAMPHEMEIVSRVVAPIYFADNPKVTNEIVFTREQQTASPIITRPNGYDAECSYSSDARFILFGGQRGGDGAGAEDVDLFVFDTTTNKTTPLVTADGYDGGPFFSPDGKWICYRSDRKGNNLLQLFIAELNYDASGAITGIKREVQLTDNEHVNWAPFWHPSGKFLVYATSEVSHQNYEIYAIEVNPDKPMNQLRKKRITHADGFDGLPAFTPDGKWMIWTSQRGPNTMNDPRPTSQMWVARVLDIAP